MNFSGHTLIPHLNVLQNHFLGPLRNDDERFRRTYFDLEMLPYALGAAWYSLYELARVQTELVRSIPISELESTTILGLGSEPRDRMSYTIDGFLDAARRAQNGVMHYLSRGLKLSLPNSMTDLVGRIKKGKSMLPDPPSRQILEYWHQHGQRLKDYRDLAQHHALVASDARAFLSSDKQIGLYLLLPSNPEAKSASKLVFGSPRIHAYEYVRAEFYRLVGFLHWLTKGLVPKGGGGGISIVVFREPVTLGPMEGNAPADPEKLNVAIINFVQRLEKG
jgi:hypothetical protein